MRRTYVPSNTSDEHLLAFDIIAQIAVSVKAAWRRCLPGCCRLACTRLAIDFPDDESMGISHEAIYQALRARPRCPKTRAGCLLTDGTSATTTTFGTRQQAWAHVSPDAL